MVKVGEESGADFTVLINEANKMVVYFLVGAYMGEGWLRETIASK